MALKTPPSWLQNASHPAVNDRLSQQALYQTTGIIGTTSLAVTGTSGLGLSVAAGWGAIVANAASTYGVYTIYNDAAQALTITGYAVTNPRIDKIVATVSDSSIPYGTGDTVAFAIVTGTEAVSPTAPATPSNSIALATVLVPVGSGSITITDARTFITSNAFLPLGGGTVSGATTFSANVTHSAATTDTFGAGTNTVPPVVFTTGSNGTTATGAVAGAMEFDGSAFYGVTTATQGRGVLSLNMFTSGVNPSPVATAGVQNWFPTANDNFAMLGNTTYLFEGVLNVSNTGTTAHTLNLIFGGTASSGATSIAWTCIATNGTVATPTATLMTYATVATTTPVTTSVSAASNNTLLVRGIIRTNAAGTFIPQFQYSAGPGGSTTLAANNWMRVTPIGSGTVASVGAWS